MRRPFSLRVGIADIWLRLAEVLPPDGGLETWSGRVGMGGEVRRRGPCWGLKT